MSQNRRSFLKLLSHGSASAVALASPALIGVSSTHAHGWLDGTDFGLVPNANKDQSRLMQAAFTQAAEQKRPLFLAGGRYVVGALSFPSNLHLIGSKGQTELLLYPGASHLGLAQGARNLVIDSVSFRGEGLAGSRKSEGLVVGLHCERLHIKSCDFSYGAKSGLYLEHSSGRIEGNRFRHLGDAALFSRSSNGLWVENNDIADIGNVGILLHRHEHGVDGSRILNNRIHSIRSDKGGSGQYGNGINVYRTHNVLISGNEIRDCGFSAIRSNGAKHCQIVQNSCMGSAEVAIYSEFDFDGAVIANNVIEGGVAGISVANFMQGGRRVSVANNLVRGIKNKSPHADSRLDRYGIYVEADAVVLGNVIEDCPRFGMIAGWGPYMRNILLSSNIVRQSDVGLAVSLVEKAGSMKASQNLFEAVRLPIAGYRWYDRVEDNLLNQLDKLPDRIALSGNTHISP